MATDPVLLTLDLFTAAVDDDTEAMRRLVAPLDRDDLERLLLAIPGPVVAMMLSTMRGRPAERRRQLRGMMRQAARERGWRTESGDDV